MLFNFELLNLLSVRIYSQIRYKNFVNAKHINSHQIRNTKKREGKSQKKKQKKKNKRRKKGKVIRKKMKQEQTTDKDLNIQIASILALLWC